MELKLIDHVLKMRRLYFFLKGLRQVFFEKVMSRLYLSLKGLCQDPKIFK